jgi:hypothetical protein
MDSGFEHSMHFIPLGTSMLKPMIFNGSGLLCSKTLDINRIGSENRLSIKSYRTVKCSGLLTVYSFINFLNSLQMVFFLALFFFL